MADKDLEAKVQCLIEAFKHDRSVIVEVLKKNNFSLDAAAIELSEIPLPSKNSVPLVQPQPNYQPQPIHHQPPPSYNFHQQQLPPRIVPGVQPKVQQQPQQLPPQPKPTVKKGKEEEEDILYSAVTKALGNTGLTESTIYDVHNQNGKNLDQTLRAIKDLAYSPTEEHKKMEELQIRYEKENNLREQMLKLETESMKKRLEEEEARLEKLKQLKEKELLQREYLEKLRREELKERRAQEEIKLQLEMQMEKERREKLVRERNAQEQKLLLEKKSKEELERKRQERLEKEQMEKLFVLEKQKAQEQEEKERLLKIGEKKNKALQEEIERQRQLMKEQELQKNEELKKQSEEQQRLFERLIQEQENLKKLQKDQLQKSEELQMEKKKTEDLLRQTEQEATIKELAHSKLIENQKNEIIGFQQQIDILKQKEYQSKQENQNLSVKSQQEIENLRLLLSEIQEKNQHTALRLENEQLLRQQIQDLEDQKDFQRSQIQELEQIKQLQIQELEAQLFAKQNELIHTKKSNFITLSIELDLVQKEQINVEYHLESKFDQGTIYWIGIYPTHQPKHDRYHSYQRVASASGQLTFPSIIPGHYEARLFRDKYTLLQTSNSVMIGPKVELGVHVIGDKIDVTFLCKDVDPQTYQFGRDWLGIYSQGARNKKYIESIYANSNGSVQFSSPRVPGLYEIRYFTYPTKYNEQVKSSFELIDNDSVVISTPIAQPDEPFKVEYTINTYQPSTSDWIGIFPVNEENNKNYITSKYTNGTGHGQLEFNAPSKSGSYEIRFFSYAKGKYLAHKISDILMVTGNN